MRIGITSAKRKIITRDIIHNILYRLSPAYRGIDHVNSTLLRMESEFKRYENAMKDVVESIHSEK